MLKIREITRLIEKRRGRPPTKQLETLFQKECDFLCQKFKMTKYGKIRVVISKGKERLPKKEGNFLFPTTIIGDYDGFAVLLTNKLFIHIDFIHNKENYEGVLLTLHERVRRIIYIFLHEFAHFHDYYLPYKKDRHPYHRERFWEICDMLTKPYGIYGRDQVMYKSQKLY